MCFIAVARGTCADGPARGLAERMTDTHYVIAMHDAELDEILTVRAREVSDSPLGLSFLRIADFVFDSSSPIVNPKEDALRQRLENVRSLHVSIHRVLSISEVGDSHTGLSFANDRSNLVAFPSDQSSS